MEESERLDRRLDHIQSSCEIRHKDINSCFFEIRDTLARIEVTVGNAMKELNTGDEEFKGLKGRVTKIENTLISYRGYLIAGIVLGSFVGNWLYKGATLLVSIMKIHI